MVEMWYIRSQECWCSL